MAENFIKNKEDFSCGQCGSLVLGNGYTNHCPDCLWSKHVDINPGDRLEFCRGMMEPAGIEIKNRDTSVVHKCVKCGSLKRNKVAKNDNHERIILISV